MYTRPTGGWVLVLMLPRSTMGRKPSEVKYAWPIERNHFFYTTLRELPAQDGSISRSANGRKLSQRALAKRAKQVTIRHQLPIFRIQRATLFLALENRKRSSVFRLQKRKTLSFQKGAEVSKQQSQQAECRCAPDQRQRRAAKRLPCFGYLSVPKKFTVQSKTSTVKQDGPGTWRSQVVELASTSLQPPASKCDNKPGSCEKVGRSLLPMPTSASTWKLYC